MTNYRELEEEFFRALYNSIENKDHLGYKDSTKAYYDEKYLRVMQEEMKDIDSKEIKKPSDPKKPIICSLASSGRLCLLDFYDHKDGIERPLATGVPGGPAKIDAVIGDKYYECKCQEIVKGERKRLTKAYRKSSLFNEFGINIDDSCIDKKGNLDFSLRKMGIDSDKKYYELHFNVKQLFCHLIAIAKAMEDGKQKPEAILQYVIYCPSEQEIKKSTLLDNLYKELNDEIEAIRNSDNIKMFCNNKRHKISLNPPDYRDVHDIEDIVYFKAYNSI